MEPTLPTPVMDTEGLQTLARQMQQKYHIDDFAALPVKYQDILARAMLPNASRLVQKTAALIAENYALKKRALCQYCKVNPPNLTYLPCGHIYLCKDCSDGPGYEEFCSRCHKDIMGEVRTFY